MAFTSRHEHAYFSLALWVLTEEPYKLSGCRLKMCSAPADTTGYTIEESSLAMHSFFVTARREMHRDAGLNLDWIWLNNLNTPLNDIHMTSLVFDGCVFFLKVQSPKYVFFWLLCYILLWPHCDPAATTVNHTKITLFQDISGQGIVTCCNLYERCTVYT